MAAGIDREELRALVRQALTESLGSAGPAPAPPGDGLADEMRAALARGKPAKVTVSAANETDLDRFARAIAIACEDASLKAAIIAGDLRFAPAGPPPPRAAAVTTKPAAARTGTFQFGSGVLSEAKIVEISRNHQRIVIGEEVVLTPLARDKAREMKVEIVRQKP